MATELDFHDGFLDGILLLDDNARLLLRSSTGLKSMLELLGVEAFRANDLKQGNIILDLKLMSPDELDLAFIFEAYGYSDEMKKTFVVKDWVESATRKGLTALELTPSYGCSISAVFKSYKLTDGRPVA